MATRDAFSPGPPTAALVNPGQCVLNENWMALRLMSKVQVGINSYVFTFELPKTEITGENQALNLSTCACVLALPSGGKTTYDSNGRYVRYAPPVSSDDGKPFRPRAYTPISTNRLVGAFQLLIKIYPTGKFTSWLHKLTPGRGTVMFAHLDTNVKIQYPFGKPKKIGMIVGGTGITPMIQIMHAVLGTAGNTSKINVLYGSRTQDDILAKQLLDDWLLFDADRLSICYTLSHEPPNSDWKGTRGLINVKLLMEQLALHSFPSPSEDCIILVCGPDPMFKAICGPRVTAGFCTKQNYSGWLKDMGYPYQQVYRF